ncbi:hypothetical protein CANMA_004553 [Candida margitis]|uniref:uncharacterized protein n=1 Tax=Candida margitis TaxID=1775924 RepID=UPI002226F594|nr:uncharacterized protein CANMA_004553 [Candida margitis]KAI5956124.1 hypothetical protein CANMA_004553 [Candida margitis]
MSDKSEDISNNSLERDNDTYMDERPTDQRRQLMNMDDGSSATPNFDENDQEGIERGEKISNHREEQPQSELVHDKKNQQSATPPPPQYVSFFSREYKSHRMQIHKRFVLINMLMATLILTALSIYWGSYYEISDNLKELKMLVVIGDENTIEGVPPVFGDSMEEILQRPQAKAIGNWYIYKESEFETHAQDNNNTIRGEILRQVHHQLYWSAIYVKPNASYNYYQALVNGDTRYNVSDNTITAYYETARDFLVVPSYVTPQLEKTETFWLDQQSSMISQLVENSTIESASQKQVLAQPVQFTVVDRLPVTNHVLNAPMQLGFIYLIIVSFFQVSFFSEPHQKVAKTPVKRIHYLLYRYISSILSFFFLSLVFGLVTLAFQVNFDATYGKSGFLVYWSISFLTMCAVGLATEIMAMLIIPIYPPLLGFWLIFWVIVNIAPTYTVMALTNNFFRYGYAMPIHNSYEATKTVFFDVYKGQLGRNFGILVAWVVVLTVAFPFVLRRFAQSMGKKAAALAAKAQGEKGVDGDDNGEEKV